MQIPLASCDTIHGKEMAVNETSKRYFQSGYWMGLNLNSRTKSFPLSKIEDNSDCSFQKNQRELILPVISQFGFENFSCSLFVLMKHPHDECVSVIQTSQGKYRCVPTDDRQLLKRETDSTLLFLNGLFEKPKDKKTQTDDYYLRVAKEAIMLSVDTYPVLFIEKVSDIKVYSELAESDLIWQQRDRYAAVIATLGSPFVVDMAALYPFASPCAGRTYDTLAFCLLADFQNSVIVDSHAGRVNIALYTWSPAGGELYEWRLGISDGKIESLRQTPIVRKFGFYFSNRLF